MSTQQTFIAELEHARATMQGLLDDLEAAQKDRQEVYPTWTIKELLAHLTGWDDACIASLQAHLRGDVPATPAARGLDPYNASTVYEREALSLEQVIAEWDHTRETFKNLIRALPVDKVEEPFVFPWGPKGRLSDMVKIFAEHEIEHAEEIRKKLLG